MKLIEKTVFSLSVIFGLFIIGPEVKAPDLEKALPKINDNLFELKEWIIDRESVLENLKPNNASRLIYFDTVPKKTPYSVVYLHGFSASTGEGSPVHLNIARALGANLYLPRLAGHGLVEDEPLLDFTADKYLDSAREALAVAKIIGEKVIVVSSSTGGTLSLILGSDPQISAMLLFGPNIEIFNPAAKLLTLPWGLNIARLYVGSKYHVMNKITEKKKKILDNTIPIRAYSSSSEISRRGYET
jgi:pimeloyl-ACP methyl ester carboxylesterase